MIVTEYLPPRSHMLWQLTRQMGLPHQALSHEIMPLTLDLTLPMLEEAEWIAGIEDAARIDFKRGDDPLEVYGRHKRF